MFYKRYRVLGFLVISSFFSSFVYSSDAMMDPAAVVNGQTISREEMDQALKREKFEAEMGLYEKQKGWIDKKVESLLQAKEAEERKLTVEALQKMEVDDKMEKITDADLMKIYEENKNRFVKREENNKQIPFEEVKDRIQNYLEGRNRSKRHDEFISDLRKKADISVNLVKPIPPKFDVSFGPDDPVMGKLNAPVTILEFTDFQCPYCLQTQPTLLEILKKYPKDVKVVTRNYPLSFHERARPLALAALCAKDQGKYEEYRKAVFGNDKLSDKDLVDEAVKLKMKKSKFEKCISTKKFEPQMERDIVDAQKWGVSGTPAYFVNGYFLSGARPMEDFEELIQMALAEKK